MKNLIYYCFSFSLFFSCQSKKAETSLECKNNFNTKVKFTYLGIKTIEVGESFSSYPDILQIIQEKNGKKVFVIFDRKRGKIAFIDYMKLAFLKIINIEKEGPTGVGNEQIHGIYVHNEDSIFVALDQKVHIINSKGQSIYKISLFSDKKQLSGMPYISQDKPAHFIGGHLYVSSFTDGDSYNLENFEKNKINSFLKINIKNNKVEQCVVFPEPYKLGIYGINYLFPYQTFNSRTNKFIFSFSAFHNLMIYDFDLNKYKLAEAISKDFCQIQPMKKNSDDEEIYRKYWVQNPAYGGVFYDKLNDYYLRIAYKGRSIDDYNSGKFWKRFSVIILDKNFVKVGEFDIKENILNNSLYVNEGILYWIEESTDENKLKLVSYSIDKV